MTAIPMEIDDKVDAKDPFATGDVTQQMKKLQLGEKAHAEVNVFPFDLHNARRVFKYSVMMEKLTPKKTVELHRGPKHDAAVETRRRALLGILKVVMSRLADTNPSFKNVDKFDYVYDCANIMYSIHDFGGEEIKVEIDPKTDISSKSTASAYVGTLAVKVIVYIKRTLVIEPYDILTEKPPGEKSVDFEITQFLEVLTSASIMKSGDFHSFKNKHYPKSSRQQTSISGPRVLKHGCEKNCRLVLLNGKREVVLQIDAKKSPFFDCLPLIDFLKEFADRGDWKRDLESSRGLRKAQSQLKGLWAKTTHLEGHQRRFDIAGLEARGACRLKFSTKDGVEMTVEEFFQEKYKMRLRYPDLPMVTERRAQGFNYYPLEVLDIERGQRVTTQKMTSDMAEQMIRQCQLRPQELKDYIRDAISSIVFSDGDTFLKTFGISVNTNNWVSVDGRKLAPPVIQYRDNKISSSGGVLRWNLNGSRFLHAAKIKKMIFLNFDGALRRPEDENFVRTWKETARCFGADFDCEVTYEDMRSESLDDLNDLFADATRKGYQFVMAVTRNKLDPVHNNLKLLEAQYGVVTQHLSSQTVKKALTGNRMTIQNVLLKSNVKLGGVNHSVIADPHMLSKAGIQCPDLFDKKRMWIGLDVSHAGPMSYADRALKLHSSTPSIVGMAYSLRCATDLGSDYWAQEPKLQRITELDKHIETALTEYRNVNGSLPSDIVILRSGLSEGEFAKVAEEVADIRRGFGMLDEKYDPSITCVSVQTNSNYRLVPQRIDPRAPPKEQNIKSGTVLDGDLVSPDYPEFIQIFQTALQGTARPVRTTVVNTVKGKTGRVLTIPELEVACFCLSHGHQAATVPTTVPAPLKAATALSNRGRNNFNSANHASDDTMSMLSGGSSGGRFVNNGQEDYFVDVTRDIASKLKNQYFC